MLITPLGLRIVVRFARKPIWMPTAPSKLFRITNHTFYSEEEVKQIAKLRHVYLAQMESIYSYMKREFYIPATQAGGMPPDFLAKEQADEEQLLAENDRINAEVAKRKERFFEEQFKKLEESVMEEKLAIEEALIDSGRKMDEFVSVTKSNPDSFVTSDNIEARIEYALENPIDLEFYIDRQGRRYGASSSSRNEARSRPAT